MLIYKKPEARDEPHERLDASNVLRKALPHHSCVHSRLIWFQLEIHCICNLFWSHPLQWQAWAVTTARWQTGSHWVRGANCPSMHVKGHPWTRGQSTSDHVLHDKWAYGYNAPHAFFKGLQSTEFSLLHLLWEAINQKIFICRWKYSSSLLKHMQRMLRWWSEKFYLWFFLSSVQVYTSQ